ncbi:MAG TPA: serine hydrolase [Thermoanaerobaculia bacterium]|nr:serine hydrolase [Thermoanaerobaculia bacterium]
MTRRALPFCTLLLAAGCATAPATVDGILQQHPGKTIAVAFYDLRDGRTFFRNEHEDFHAASTMKVPVMLGIFEAVSRGDLHLDQPVRVRNEFPSIYDGSIYSLDPKDDSDAAMYGYVGKDVPLEFLVRRMIDRSSNLATNNVIDLIGAKRVMDLMHRIGAEDIRVLRGVEDQKAFDHGMNNTTTATDLMLIFRALAEHRIIDETSSRQMIGILAAQEFNSGIPAGLPPGTRVAHKTGWITRIAHDAGIVFRPDGSAYVLVVLTRGFDDENAAHRVIAQISRAVWNGALTALTPTAGRASGSRTPRSRPARGAAPGS